MTAELAGKVAVITGGGSGLGAAMGRTFASVGMGVAALDIDEAAAKRVAAELYVREEGEWRIARTRLARVRVDPLT